MHLVKIIDNTNFLSHTYCTDWKNDHPWSESQILDNSWITVGRQVFPLTDQKNGFKGKTSPKYVSHVLVQIL